MKKKKALEQLKKEIVQKAAEKAAQRVLDEIPNRKDIFGGGEGKDATKAKEKAAEWLKALYAGDLATVKALSGGSSGEGAELVPEAFSSEIIRLAPNYGVARKEAQVRFLDRNTKFPTLGSVVAYRVGSGEKITSSQPTTGQVAISYKKLAVLVPMENELLKDANVDVVDALAQLSAEALAEKEDEWLFKGLASGEGIFQNANVPVVTLDTGKTSFSDVSSDDLLEALNYLDESALTDAKWYMSFSVFNALRGKKDSQGRYIVQEPGGGRPATLWNLPVVFTRVLPKTTDSNQADTKFIVLGNLRYAILADKREYSMDISREATVTDTDGTTVLNLFEQDMSAVRVIERVDIQLAEADKAFVVIKTAAS